ncbi:sporulation inhibitor of replication protein SirA [Niallia endozanthoxylica]|uniref:Sporulation inhibitor of replication protein SirA n=1 Tax=Niallia endozanthoxylica TaxID=2036016 RepID=A0A5J5HM67_9BACI|nr:sporulation inhibitor of replication protein SirA [Niallia endozanthoxylica]KAA9021831.1 sporulation inhibitor of replication protein SirA [Niallia endozanthoxylica]
MRTYQLYLFDDEFASHYFGKERMVYQLFKDYKEAIGEYKRILEKQIDFILKPIQELKIHRFVTQYLQNNKDFYTNNGTYYLEIGKRSTAKLVVHGNYLVLKANGNYEAETIFFEVLRKTESSFIAIDLDHQRYGWLKPIKERKFV